MTKFNKFVFKKGGLIHQVVDEDNTTLIEASLILSILEERSFTLEEGFKLLDYFKLFENYPYLKFICYRHFIEDYIEEFKESIHNIELKNSKDFIVMDRYYEKDLLEDDYFLSTEVSLKKHNEENKYAIEMSPLYTLLGYNLKIEEVIRNHHDDKPNLYDISSPFSIFEFITEIISELSFMGPPGKRDSELNMIKEMIKDIDNGNIETYELKEVDFSKYNEDKNTPKK